MDRLTENVRARVTVSEKEKLISEVTKKDTNISEFIRNLITEYFYEPSEEEIEENIFIEKVKALKVLTGVNLDICRKVLIDVSGDSLKAMTELQGHRLKSREMIQDKYPSNPYKVRFIFTEKGVQELSSYRGELRVTDDDLEKTRMCTLPMVDIDFRPESSCGINYIEVLNPVKATRRTTYDNIVAYIKNLMRLDKDKGLEIRPERKYFSPIIGIQSVEDALYDIIDFYEKNETVKSELIKEYMKKINDLHIKHYGHRQ